MKSFWAFMTGGSLLSFWVIALIVIGLATGIYRGFFRARKIQPKGFSWRTFRNEALFAVVTVTVSGALLGYITSKLTQYGFITYNTSPTSGWVVFLEFVLYFFAFDAYFYWFHRLMHIGPIYTYVHKIHHYSTSPNLLTTLSVSPLESVINGGFVPLFTSLLTVHEATMAYVLPTNIIMGLYVHSGYEFFPRWWNKSWATKWFITTTFHDQHHKYFRWNFGGYTTIWDWLCGTVRPKFVADFEQLKARVAEPQSPGIAVGATSPER
jgi:sterol desaturase/sphingolipid hydroxylase (fatty acid hydroxylase superfamily)